MNFKKVYKINRPTFNFEEQPVRAAGILIYTKIRHNKYFLFRKGKKNFYEDCGGKTDNKDKSYLDTAVRECVEETNGKLFNIKDNFNDCENKLKKYIDKYAFILYFPKAKYVLYILKVDAYVKYLNLDRFGKKETTNNKNHSFNWYIKIPNPLHPRLNKKLIKI